MDNLALIDRLKSLTSKEIEKELMAEPQVRCPVVHHFAPGICIREVSMPADTLAFGHHQKFEHLNVMLKGKVMMLDESGNTQEITAPHMYVAKPGRKLGYVVEDMVWQNIYATDLKDANAVEEYFVEKNDMWVEHYDKQFALAQLHYMPDRLDYEKINKDSLTRLYDKIPSVDAHSGIPTHLRIAKSPIDGIGLFMTSRGLPGSHIARLYDEDGIKQILNYINHAECPNTYPVRKITGEIILVNQEEIPGCEGGNLGTELTINYRELISLFGLE